MTESVSENKEIIINEPKKINLRKLIPDVILILLMIVGGYYRLVGLAWDADQHVHPDELFLTNVESAIRPVESFAEYWDTEESTLNPHNVGHGFFVYGTLPIFLVRYVADWVGQSSYGEVVLVGRQISALFDLGVVLLVYLVANRLYNRRVGIIAATFSTFTVLQIQTSHFFTVDNAMNFFTMLCIYFAILIVTGGDEEKPFELKNFLWFGLALGLAVSSKVQTGVVSVLLPLAVFARLYKLKKSDRMAYLWQTLSYMIGAAFVGLIIFRIFQPYAFSGPGFFNFKPNEKWVANLRYLFTQATGDVDWPPSTQWARRPVWFSAQNMVLWGLGLPMGIAAWAGFIWVGWRMIQKEWQQHLVLWSWTAFYFTWQSSVFNPTMRYQLPIYPALAVFAGWFVVNISNWAKTKNNWKPWLQKVLKVSTTILASLTVVGTILYATAFIEVYKEPHSRVAISEWIYQNIPGPLTIAYENDQGGFSQPVSFSYDFVISPVLPYQSSFTAKASGAVDKILVHSISTPKDRSTLILTIHDAEFPETLLAQIDAKVEFSNEANEDKELIFSSPTPISFVPDHEYVFNLKPALGQDPVMLSTVELFLLSGDELKGLDLNIAPILLSFESAFETSFSPDQPTIMAELSAELSPVVSERPEKITLEFIISTSPDLLVPITTAELTVDLKDSPVLDQYFFFDQQVNFEEGQAYYFKISTETENSEVTLKGSALAGETGWDLTLPLRIGYDGYGGIFQRGLDLDMYADDNDHKRENFLRILQEAEYITISSSRQWASTTRIPERYPMVTEYFRQLMGCPESETIEYCYNVAELGDYSGNLGFDLIKVEVTKPNLFGIEINDQFSEEAFTVYDHTKTFVFEKSADYQQKVVEDILMGVDLSKVIRLTPKQASAYEGPEPDLLLPKDVFEAQQTEGTWSELFNINSFVNRSQFITVLVWYLALLVLGLASYPIIRTFFPTLSDRGYPLVRIAGLLFLAYFSWISGSIGLGYSRLIIGIIYLLILTTGAFMAYRQRDELREELKQRWAYFLTIEILFLAFFLFSLIVRLGNADLWHPYKGGEKPMDFAYFNAILKSASFPPYDPWFAGGYINYYYYGYVYVGSLVKLLGIIPSVAYNLIIPTLFAMLSMGAFSISWNLYLAGKEKLTAFLHSSRAIYVGLAAALGTAMIGNLGTITMIFRGYQRIGATGIYDQGAVLITKWGWAIKGFFQVIGGQSLPYGVGDWYWIPSRAIEVATDTPITEFPWFTFIYADLHPHMISLPITILALAWILSVFFGSLQGKKISILKTIASLFFGAMVIGALRPTNTWDLPTYLALGVVAIIYAVWRYQDGVDWKWAKNINNEISKYVLMGLSVLGLIWLTFNLYLPFSKSYIQGYSSVNIWPGSQTPTTSYLIHWGIFLFILISFLVWETRQWMAQTPLSSLRKLQPYTSLILLGGVSLIVAMAILHFSFDVRVYWIGLPLALWSAVMLLRPGLKENKKAVFFLMGTSFFLTIMVEVIVLSGDIGRMNTVFKFYLQVWVLFAVSSAAALGWLFDEIKTWNPAPRMIWRFVLVSLLSFGFMYPFIATSAKMRDRFSAETPHTLDGIDYMAYAKHNYEGVDFDFSQDLRAIEWLQQNVSGTPVIVEGNTPIYYWGSRISIYTGLPTVLGWDWHQIQQRVAGPAGAVTVRQTDVRHFYTTENISDTLDFLDTYDVSFIILGQLERAYYPGDGVDKFELYDGDFWIEVYRDEETVIYQVRD